MSFNMRAMEAAAPIGRLGPVSARIAASRRMGRTAGEHAVSSARADDDRGGPRTEPDPRRLEAVFHACFREAFSTTLEGGGDEPLYVASREPARTPHRIIYREDYFASALHEIAHWCLAGAERRRLDDYGYWYDPDGRSAERQRAFEAAEARPQALEWILSDACGHAFHLSADNLDGGSGPSEAFARAVERARRHFETEGLPRRAARFLCGLDLEFERDRRGPGAGAAEERRGPGAGGAEERRSRHRERGL